MAADAPTQLAAAVGTYGANKNTTVECAHATAFRPIVIGMPCKRQRRMRRRSTFVYVRRHAFSGRLCARASESRTARISGFENNSNGNVADGAIDVRTRSLCRPGIWTVVKWLHNYMVELGGICTRNLVSWRHMGTFETCVFNTFRTVY